MGEPAPYEQGAGSHHPADIFPAKSLGGTLAEVITYDRRMAEAAEALGMSVVAPGREP